MPTRALYGGPIEVGMHFIWEVDAPRVWARVVVIRIDTGGDERLIWTRTLSNTPSKPIGVQTWNEEGRCREAFTPCTPRGEIVTMEPAPFDHNVRPLLSRSSLLRCSSCGWTFAMIWDGAPAPRELHARFCPLCAAKVTNVQA